MRYTFFLLSTLCLCAQFDESVFAKYEEHVKSIQKGEIQLENIKKKVLKFQAQVVNHHNQFSNLLKYLHQLDEYSSSLSMLSIPSKDDFVHVLVVSDYLNQKMSQRQKQLLSFLKKYSTFKKSYKDLYKNLKILKDACPQEEKKIIHMMRSTYKEDVAVVREIDKRIKSCSSLKEILVALNTLPVTDGEEVNLTLLKPIHGSLSMISQDPEVNLVHFKMLSEYDGFCKNPMDSIVVYKGQLQGKSTLILQYNPFQIVIFGLKDIYCQVGDIIKPNMPIAYVKKGEEIHFEIYKNGVNMDPLPYIKDIL